MEARAFHLSEQGASHIKRKRECQDASSCYDDEHMAVAVVCDGHGGDDYIRSALGAAFGCEAAEKNIRFFMENIDKEAFFEKPDYHLRNLEASIINDWNESVRIHCLNHPFCEKELEVLSERARKRYTQDGKIESAYGTTLIAAGMSQGFWFGIHIGDGKCIVIEKADDTFYQPIPWDPNCFLNATTSICDSDALGEFRHFYSERIPAAIFLGSDGIDDCFNNEEQLYRLYRTILYSFGTTEFEKAIDGLKEYLPRLSAKGSGDDVSIAAILNLDDISELEMVQTYDRENEKSHVEKNTGKEPAEEIR